MTYPAGLNVTKVSTDIIKHQKLTQGGIIQEGGDMGIFFIDDYPLCWALAYRRPCPLVGNLTASLYRQLQLKFFIFVLPRSMKALIVSHRNVISTRIFYRDFGNGAIMKVLFHFFLFLFLENCLYGSTRPSYNRTFGR